MNKDTQSWSNSNLTEMDELLQKVQQLERENAEQSVLLGKGGERECALLGKVERLERENAALRNKVASLENQSLWKCTCGGTDCEGQKENRVLRSLLREAIREHVDPYDLPEGDDYIARVKTALGEGQL